MYVSWFNFIFIPYLLLLPNILLIKAKPMETHPTSTIKTRSVWSQSSHSFLLCLIPSSSKPCGCSLVHYIFIYILCTYLDFQLLPKIQRLKIVSSVKQILSHYLYCLCWCSNISRMERQLKVGYLNYFYSTWIFYRNVYIIIMRKILRMSVSQNAVSLYNCCYRWYTLYPKLCWFHCDANVGAIKGLWRPYSFQFYVFLKWGS